MDITVVIPTYNHALFVRETLISVMSQSLAPKEVLVIDDGSSDNTCDIVREFVKSGAVQYLYQENRGQAYARNVGLSMATGSLICFLDDDDLWPEDKLEWQRKYLAASPESVLVYGFGETFGDSEGDRVPAVNMDGDISLKQLLNCGCMYSPGQAMYRTELLQRIGGFDPGIWGADDWELALRLRKIGRFAYEDRLALKYRCHPYNASKNFSRMYRNVCKTHWKHANFVERFRNNHVFHSLYGGPVLLTAEQALQQKDWPKARQLLWQYLVSSPKRLFTHRQLIRYLAAAFVMSLVSQQQK